MRRALQIQEQADEVKIISDLTSVFENIASIRIAQVKDKVVSSGRFFNDLWVIYRQLRINPEDQLQSMRRFSSDRSAFLMITGEAGLSGDIDRQLTDALLEQYDPNTTDVLSVGAHGALQLSERGVGIKAQFPLPDIAGKIDIGDIVALLREYKNVTVFYEKYQTLFSQNVERLELLSAVVEQGGGETMGSQRGLISSKEYIFEPSLEDVVHFMESTMIEIVLSQVILESHLAQYASRFNAMHIANRKAQDMTGELKLAYHRARRAESDERLKEIITALHHTS
jgi:F-type H+-transporting ATPase subunit gamma